MPAGTYNLGSGQPTTVRELAELVQDVFEDLTGARPPLQAAAAPPQPPKPYFVAVGRLGDQGLRVTGELRDAVEETAGFCLEHRDELTHD